MKHTKGYFGPYKHVDALQQGQTLIAIGPLTSGTEDVAYMNPSNPNLVADAALLSAAPELLDRLTECLGYLEADDAPAYFVAGVKEAIRKARGL